MSYPNWAALPHSALASNSSYRRASCASQNVIFRDHERLTINIFSASSFHHILLFLSLKLYCLCRHFAGHLHAAARKILAGSLAKLIQVKGFLSLCFFRSFGFVSLGEGDLSVCFISFAIVFIFFI